MKKKDLLYLQIDTGEVASQRNQMIVMLIDEVNSTTTIVQTIEAPLMGWRKPERLWLGYVHLEVDGHIAKLAMELEAEEKVAGTASISHPMLCLSPNCIICLLPWF